ncbi:MAG TPA: efflux RND transporter periplasmic adaptor subunit [Blastocatellia bacterium]|jgi:multidrug efflux pump subunit AcrA (membrane-fusion protein)|nr:efflux RND transporter periplasmic adaptor subunit [Blastocatellia bacterium]
MKFPFKIKQIHIITVGVLLVIAMMFAARSRSRTEEAARLEASQPAEIHPVSVTTSTALSRQVAAFIQATGSFAADETSDVAPESSGQVVATPVDVGAFVADGAVIARLDDRDARLRLQQAEAAERQAAAAVRQAQERIGLGQGGAFDANAVPEVRAARQNYEAAEAQAKLADVNAQRYTRLVETGDVSRSVFDQARTQAETARAQANAARQQLEVAIHVARQSNVGISQAQAQLEGARSQASLAREALADTVVKAPFAGYISDRPTAIGEYVTPASKIATVLRINPIKLRLQLPEADAGRVQSGTPVVATVSAYPDKEFAGKVTVINPAIDPVSRTVTVEVDMSNPGNVLRPNMFATARIMQPGGTAGVFIPREAIIKDAATGSARVYVVEGDAARLRVVQVGKESGGLVRVASGVNAGEAVATNNLDQLFDGSQVLRQ